MEPKQISCGDLLPNLSAKHQWLVAQNLEADEQIFYSMDNPLCYYQCRIPQLKGRLIRACFHGWVILSSYPNIGNWSLWNPPTCKLIGLPPLIHELGDSHECCLTSPPDDWSSIFLLTTNEKPTIVFCRLNCKRKKLKWTEMSYAKQLKMVSGEDCFLSSPTCCNGKVYALTVSHCYHFVMEIDIMVKDKEVVISLLPFVQVPSPFFHHCPCVSVCSSFIPILTVLKGSCTELFYIEIVFKDGIRETVGDVFLLKLDMKSMTWEVTEGIKDATFFMDLVTGSVVFYRPQVAQGFGGCVHILGDMGKVMYSYHAIDRTISLSSMPSFLVQESQVLAWAMLECRLEGEDADSKQEDKDGEIVIKSDKCINEIKCCNESHLLNIPFHVLEMIMELCVGVEYMNFRATCKRCYLAAPQIQWSNKTTLTRLQPYSLVSPWLMVLNTDRGIFTFIDPVCGDKYFIKTPPTLIGNYHIHCSRYGWLLMHKHRNAPLVFFNPFTGDICELPELPWVINSHSFCFSAPPTSPDCMVVGFTILDVCYIFINFVAREPSWQIFHLDFGIEDPYSYHFPTFHGQDLYALHNEGEIDVLRDLAKDYSYFGDPILVAKAQKRCNSPAQYFLASCDQHVLLVVVGEFGESVEVFNLNDSKEEWEKIDGIGKHTIYISDTTCLCIEAKLPEMENKIYFPRVLHPESGKVVFYSLDTCRYYTCKNIEESFGDLFGTRQHLYPHTWIEPSWS